MQLEWSEDQLKAIDYIVSWYMNDSKTHTTLGGLAGTGKTVLISHLSMLIKEATGSKPTCLYCAFTGRAAGVMRSKGIPAKTIHSTIYDAVVSHDPETGFITHEYTLKDELNADLIVVDEASMVGKELFDDLRSFDIPLLLVGDHGQLSPVDSIGGFNLMENPEIKLENIHRQALNSEIIKLSMAVRTGKEIPCYVGKETRKIQLKDLTNNDLLRVSQVITGKNTTRVELNKRIRKMLGRPDDSPVVGDRMTFLRNNKEKNVTNGQQFVVDSVGSVRVGFKIGYVNEEGESDNALIWKTAIDDPRTLSQIPIPKNEYRRDLLFASYANAITVHKSQSGEWPSVMLFDTDRFLSWKPEDRARFLYTAITRAQEEYIWVC